MPVQAATWYVDAAAGGSNNGTSWANAWRDTTNIVWGSVVSNDVVYIQGGRYTKLRPVGVTGVTIAIAPNASSNAVFSQLPTDSSGSGMSDADYCTIDGLLGTTKMFKFLGRDGIYTADGSIFLVRFSQHSTIRGIEIDRSALYNTDTARIDGIQLNNSSVPSNDFFVIEDCSIHHITGDGININSKGPSTGFDQFIIRRCRITNTMDDAIQCSGNVHVSYCFGDRQHEFPKFGGHQDGVQTAIGGKYIHIHGNEFVGYGQNLFIEYSQGPVMLYNNILRGGGSTSGSSRGMTISAQSPYEGVWLMENNICANFLTFQAILGGGSILSATTNLVVGNSIFVNCKAVGANSFWGTNNVWWDYPGVQYYDTSGLPVNPPADRQTGLAINTDPKFVSPTTFNYAFQAGSPCIGVATNLSAFFTTDFYGNTRTTWDLGAVAFGSTPPPIPPSPGSLTITSGRITSLRTIQ